MNVNQKRKQIISLLQDIDDDNQNNSMAALRAISSSRTSTRLRMINIRRIYELLADSDDVSTWGQTAGQIRDRLRLAVLGVHDYGDPFDGQPLRSAELDMVIDQLEQYQETNQ